MKKFEYKDYNHYIQSQRAGYERKKDRCWAVEKNIAAICEYLKTKTAACEYGLCHGTRAGFEQKWFMQFLGKHSSVIGTEIGSATVENTFQRDFNNEYPDFLGVFDFVYSNAFDHSFSPEKTITVWAHQVKIGGAVIIEWDERNEHTGAVSKPVNTTDPVSMTLSELEKNIPAWCPELRHVATLGMPVVTFGYRKAVVFERVTV